MRKRHLLEATLLAASLAGTSLTSSGHANTIIPSAFFSATAGSCSNVGSSPQSCTYTETIDTNVGPSTLSWASGTVAAPTPGVSAQVSVSTVAGIFPTGGPSAFVNYQFMIAGPTGVHVPIFAIANGDASIVSSGDITDAAAISDVTINGTLIGRTCAALGSFACTNIPFNNPTPMTLTSDTLITIHLSASAQCGTGDRTITPGLSEICTALAESDPFIYIDPTFALANQFTLDFSPGIGNSPAATPLPAALPLFASGFGVMGFLAKRRKRKSVATFAA
jgi:hypothetical protein